MPPEFSPAADGSRTFPHGVPCWVDTLQPDVDAALAFYGGLFGWTFRDAMPPDAPARYVVAQLDGHDVAAVGSGSPDAPTDWTTYVAVDDCDVAVERLRAAGATVTAEPADAGPGGRTAGVRDPEGVAFRLWQARARLGVQVANAPGAWNFSNLHTADPDAARRFYGEVLPWRFVDQGFGVVIQVPGYGDHLEATVDPGIRERQAHAPEGFADVVGAVVSPPDGDPGWHVVFTVEDRDDAIATVQRLGGTVAGTREEEWTRIAWVTDPQGAALTLSQFTPPSDW